MIFQCINIRQVPRNLANVNAWKTMFNPYIVANIQKSIQSIITLLTEW